MINSRKLNVLVFPCGSENALELYHSLRFSVHVNLIGASSKEDMGQLVFENYVGGLPNISEDNFMECFVRLVKEFKIDLVFATHDTVIQYLSQKDFGAYLVNGDSATTEIVRSKIKTYKKFQQYNWCPSFYEDIENISICFPVVCKPDLGQGAQGICICQDLNELKKAFYETDLPVVVEFLPGEELTVDCFTDRASKLIWLQPRTREDVKAGISTTSRFYECSEEILRIAQDINQELKMRGPWFFQIKKDIEGNWKLLEVSSRVAGTMVAQRAKGVNLPLMAVHDFMERNVEVFDFNFVFGVRRALFAKPIMDLDFDCVYIDFDDTLILNDNVVLPAIQFVYMCKNKSKKIYLITRHDGDILDALKKYSISELLFDEIIHITDGSKKSNYIKPKKAIFVDNHFLERKEVYLKYKIPVFDVDYLGFF